MVTTYSIIDKTIEPKLNFSWDYKLSLREFINNTLFKLEVISKLQEKEVNNNSYIQNIFSLAKSKIIYNNYGM